MQIKLDGGYEATIDLPNFWIVLPYEWRAMEVRPGLVYAITGHNILMHRLILPPVDEKETDHIDGNGLNNRERNLRHVTRSQNMMNAAYATGISGYRGVKPYGDKWQASITVNGVFHYLGTFDTAEEAAIARDDAAHKLHGEFARYNFPTRFQG